MLISFITKRFLIVLILVYLVVFGLFYIYQISDFLLTYHTKNFNVFLNMIKNFFPIVFFYTAPISTSVAMFITNHYFKRIKLFFVAQSFGISPIYIFKPFVIIGFFISFLSVFVNQSYLPNAVRNLKYIEHIYKKNQSYNLGVVRDFWMANDIGNEKIFIGASLVSSQGVFYDFKLIRVEGDHFKTIIKAKKAILGNGILHIVDAKKIDLNPFSKSYSNSIDIKTSLNIPDLNLWTKAPDEQSLKELISTIFIMKKEGLNIYPYLSIFIFKIEFSFLTFMLICVLSFYIIKSQKTIDWYKAFLIHGLVFGIAIILPYSISSKININPLYFLSFYIGAFLYSLKKFLDTQKYLF